jgi:purine-binding chemotaxis protein CheW
VTQAVDTEPYVLFTLADTEYAIPSSDVQRMEMIEHPTPVPDAPPFVDGIVFSRGHVVPAVNLRRRFGMEPAAYDARTRLIVIAVADRLVGLIVDSAREFIVIPAGTIHPPPDAMAATSGRYLRGIARIAERLVLVLDVSRILDAADHS